MANILDYIGWRGDIPFSVSPFNEVDNYIVTKIGTPDLTGVVPSDSAGVSIAQAVKTYYALHGEAGDRLGALASPDITPSFRALPGTVRFAPLRLSNYVRRVIPELTEQFSALTIALPDGSHYISFRGTDDTLMAWKEDCLMAVEKAVPAQTDAVEYLTQAAALHPGPLIVGGHSKGGNLAVYAAAMAPEAVQERILAVYNNDGPGFQEDFLTQPGYLRVRSRVHTLLPQFSLVGTLMTQETNITVVRSTRPGIPAHDGFTWEVMGTRFVRCDELSRSSRAFDESMEATLRSKSLDERREFIDDLFAALTATGAVTITELTEHRLRQALSLVRSLRRSSRAKRFALDVLEGILREYLPLREKKN